MTLVQRILHHSVSWFSRVAAMLTLLALAIMVYSVLVPAVLPVMLAMSVGHIIGAVAFGCFFLAVVIDASRAKPDPGSQPSK